MAETTKATERTACCDVHPDFPLQSCVVETSDPFGNRSKLECFRCSAPGCIRRYYGYFGYFDSAPGESPHSGAFGARPLCRGHETPLFMYVQKTETGWRYACPDPKCDRTAPFDRPAEPR